MRKKIDPAEKDRNNLVAYILNLLTKINFL